MEYHEFVELIITKVQDKMGAGYSVKVQKVLKNNDLELDGLIIMEKGKNISPTIYLASYFEQIEAGKELGEIAEDIYRAYECSSNNMPVFLSDAKKFEGIKKKIVYKLIRQQNNEKLLSDVPYTPYLDLAIVYYLLLEANENGQITALIHNNHLSLWGIEKEELHHAAEANTKKLLPVSIRPIGESMSEIVSSSTVNKEENDILSKLLMEDDATVGHHLFVLSNRRNVQGAVCMLYEGVLKEISDKWNSDIIILPSSTHEVLLMTYTENSDFEDLKAMVEYINSSSVPEEDILSDHVYVFKRNDGNVHIEL